MAKLYDRQERRKPATTVIQLRNPRIVEKVNEQFAMGVGRNTTETAENLILDGIEARRSKALVAKS